MYFLQPEAHTRWVELGQLDVAHLFLSPPLVLLLPDEKRPVLRRDVYVGAGQLWKQAWDPLDCSSVLARPYRISAELLLYPHRGFSPINDFGLPIEGDRNKPPQKETVYTSVGSSA